MEFRRFSFLGADQTETLSRAMRRSAEDSAAAAEDEPEDNVLFGTIRGRVVGLRHYAGGVNQGEMVSLVREPHNPYDKNAVMVANVHGSQIGHIRRQLAAPMAYIMDNNFAKVEGVVPISVNRTSSMPVCLSFWGKEENKTAVSNELKKHGFQLTLESKCGSQGVTPNRTSHQWLAPGVFPISTVEEVVAKYGEQGCTSVLHNLRVTQQQQEAVQSATVGQQNNPAWYALRRGRLTASNFGAVLLAEHVTPSLIKRVLEPCDLDGVESVDWGNENEQEGVKAFETAKGLKVQESGFWITESGVLGASPDGLVGTHALLEVKCPFRERELTIEEASLNKDFCLRKDGKTYQLRQDHRYWHQVQGQLHIAKRDICYFVVWTKKQSIIIPINKDAAWAKYLNSLEDIYKVQLLPKLLEQV
ncbi:uncharacterized protein LOC118230570 [Anguilla anguilla]|uniref:uncharacterized protein LOC118230570 n=1 Tax=Anguilla anguilla TaxID=7936 RepID=UPI0015AD8053|nr:uncharacterized protein LOC118230570 [Anguilla anguilla]